MTAQKRVVIVGGGFGGIAAARALDDHFAVTLIEKNDFYFHKPGALRAAVDPHWVDRMLVPYTALMKRGRVIHGAAVEVGENEVVLESGVRLPWDYLVLAMGSRYVLPAYFHGTDRTQHHAAIAHVADRIRRARAVLLVGAGPVGIEFAGEIKRCYPDKPVTLLEAASTLLPGYHPALAHRIRTQLDVIGVRLLLGESLREPFDDASALAEASAMTEYFTTRGTRIDADLAFKCYGMQLNTDILRGSPVTTLDERGQVKTNRFLQSERNPNVLVVGDITNLAEGKLGAVAGFQAAVAAENIRRLAENRTPLKPRKLMRVSPLVVPLGEHGGAAQLPLGPQGVVVGAWMASRVKGRDLLTGRAWKLLRATAPD